MNDLESVLREIEDLKAKLKDARARRDAIKNPPNDKYRKFLAQKKEDRTKVFKNYLSGMNAKQAARAAGTSEHSADIQIIKAWRDHFPAHKRQYNEERRKFLVTHDYGEFFTSEIKWLRNHPPLGWQDL